MPKPTFCCRALRQPRASGRIGFLPHLPGQDGRLAAE